MPYLFLLKKKKKCMGMTCWSCGSHSGSLWTIMCRWRWVITNVSKSLPSLRWEECAQAREGRQRVLTWMPRIGIPIKVAKRDVGFQERVFVTSHIAWVLEWWCTYMYIRILFNTTRFKTVMVINSSELCS
jgi:hypothetical protein